MPSLPAITEKGSDVGRYRRTWASAMVIDAALTRAPAWLVASVAISSAAAVVMRDSATDSAATSSAASDGGDVVGYGVSGGLAGGGHEQAGGGQRHDRLVGGRLFHQPGGDQRPDGAGGSGRLDLLRIGHCLGRLGLGRSRREQGDGLVGLGLGDYLSCLLHGGDLGPHHQPGLGGQEALADQRAAGLGDGVKERGGPVVLDEQEGQGGPWLERIGQSPRIGAVKGRQTVSWRRRSRTAVRDGHHCRQQRAEVLVITDGQPFDGAVLAFGHEKHVEQAKNSPAAQTIDLGQDPVLGTGVAAEAQGDHLQRCGHHCPPLS